MWCGRSRHDPSSLLVTFVLIFVSLSSVAAKSQPAPSHCPYECPESCPGADLDCKDTVIDECGCCPLCLLHRENAPCGVSSSCASPLVCSSRNASTPAICVQPVDMDECVDVECPSPFHPRCDHDDSRLHIAPPPSGQCCGSHGVCVCDDTKCSIPDCDAAANEQRVLVKAGAGVPGRCCDRYECRKPEPECKSVRCPPEALDEREDDGSSECPLDSHRPPIHRVPGACCPVQPGCRCRASICKPAACPDGKVVRIHKRGSGTPGRCCDEWTCVDESTSLAKSCVRDGQKYKDGEEWHVSSCELCKCKRGVTACSKMNCPKPPSQCSWIVIPEGECCPVCVGCQTERLEKKRMNETWSRDDCTTCTCSSNGESVCEKHMCRSECENPKKIDGQCCPVCDEPTILTLPSTCPSLEHCPLRCQMGLRRDDRGCFVCECLPSVTPSGAQCTTLDATNCEKQCAHGYLRNKSGCAVCQCAKCPPLHQCLKHCLYGFETNSVGCPVCKCRAMARIDATLSISEKLGRLSGKDRCVSLSPTGKVISRDGGEWWNDGCRHCFCEQQQEFCSLISCPERPNECPEDSWTQEEGACCPSCTVDTSTSSSSAASTALAPASKSLSSKHEHTVCQSPGTGRLFTDGETWQLAPCVSCTCRVGHVLCRVSSACPPVPCTQPLLVDPTNQCCPTCPTTDDDSSPSSDSSIVEACTDEGGVARASGATWRTNDCTSCKCKGGKTECFRQTCDELKSCRGVPLVLKGRCCPVCSDVLAPDAVCTYGNAVYSVHEEWRDGACRNCSCVAGGQTICRELVCPECSDPVTISGQCCPLCKDSGWASFGEGNGSLVLPSSSSSSTPSALTVVSLSLCGLILLALFIAAILFLYKKRKAAHKKCGSLSKVNSGVLLSATRKLGSQPHLLIDHWDHNTTDAMGANELCLPPPPMCSSEHNDSLLCTAESDCGSTGCPSESSSGHGSGQSDTAPLTGVGTPASLRRQFGGGIFGFRGTPTSSPKTTPRHLGGNP